MAILQGRRVWDPRIGTRDNQSAWVASSNPPLICFDWWWSGFYVDPDSGVLREDPREPSELDVEFARQAADFCDALIDPDEAAWHRFIFTGSDAV